MTYLNEIYADDGGKGNINKQESFDSSLEIEYLKEKYPVAGHQAKKNQHNLGEIYADERRRTLSEGPKISMM